MRTTLNRSIFLIASLLVAAPAFAQWPAPPSKPAQPSASSPSAASPSRRIQAEDDGSSGFAVGLRAGWAFPIGDLNATTSLGTQVAGQIPVWLEAGWRLNKNLYVGLYGQRGFGFSNNCPIGSDCSTSGWRLGVEGIYNLLPDGVAQPWAGLGVGYEWLSTSRAGEDLSYKGWELINLQVGLDFALSKQFSIGPFASISLFGKYTSVSANGVSNDLSASHNWLQTGLRATFKL
jgi:hypothetical protein